MSEPVPSTSKTGENPIRPASPKKDALPKKEEPFYDEISLKNLELKAAISTLSIKNFMNCKIETNKNRLIFAQGAQRVMLLPVTLGLPPIKPNDLDAHSFLSAMMAALYLKGGLKAPQPDAGKVPIDYVTLAKLPRLTGYPKIGAPLKEILEVCVANYRETDGFAHIPMIGFMRSFLATMIAHKNDFLAPAATLLQRILYEFHFNWRNRSPLFLFYTLNMTIFSTVPYTPDHDEIWKGILVNKNWCKAVKNHPRNKAVEVQTLHSS